MLSYVLFVRVQDHILSHRQYRLDFAGRSAYSVLYGSSKTEHSIHGNLTVYGTVTDNASKTITHYTQYEGELQLGCFVESTGSIYRDTTLKQSPYENCVSIVRQATTPNKNIIGVCTEILNDEIIDNYGNLIKPAGKYCKFASHGDCLIKCISATYTLGYILIPTVKGYAKKGLQNEIVDAMINMIPRAKITSVKTEDIDSEAVCAFISI